MDQKLRQPKNYITPISSSPKRESYDENIRDALIT